MVLLLLSEPLRNCLDSVTKQLPTELADQVVSYLSSTSAASNEETSFPRLKSGTIEHGVLVKVSEWARKEGMKDCYLQSLLKLTDIYAPPLPTREKSPELLRILSTLQLEQDRLSYASMTSLEVPQYRSTIPMSDLHENKAGKTVAEEWGDVRREVGAIVNVGASMVAVATAVWWVGGGRSNATRLGLSMAGAFAIGAIEGFLYWRYFTREEQQKVAGKTPKKRTKVPQFEGTLLSFGDMPKLGGAELKLE